MAQVFPTKSNLMSTKKSLELAKLGYDLLDRKRNILVREMMQLIDRASQIQREIDATYSKAYLALQRANVTLGLCAEFAQAIPVDNSLNIDLRSVMRVELPVVTLGEDKPGMYYGLNATNSMLDEAYLSFVEVKRMTARLAEIENNVYRLADAIKKMPEVALQLSDGTRYALTGRVSTVSGVLDQSTGSASVRALFKNTNGMLRSGSTGNILIPQPSKDLIIIPQRATYEIQDMKYVYVLGDSSKAVARNIKVSPVDDGQTYIVTEGLNVGDEIVTEGVGTAVKAGTVVKPKAAAPAEEAPAAKDKSSDQTR